MMKLVCVVAGGANEKREEKHVKDQKSKMGCVTSLPGTDLRGNGHDDGLRRRGQGNWSG